MNQAQQRYELARESFEDHIDRCRRCWKRVWRSDEYDSFCGEGRELSDELAAATVAALPDNGKTFLQGEQKCAPSAY